MWAVFKEFSVLKPETAKRNHRNETTETTETSETKPPKRAKRPKRNKRKRDYRNNRNESTETKLLKRKNDQNEAAETPKARKFPNREWRDTSKLCCYRFGERWRSRNGLISLLTSSPAPNPRTVFEMFNQKYCLARKAQMESWSRKIEINLKHICWFYLYQLRDGKSDNPVRSASCLPKVAFVPSPLMTKERLDCPTVRRPSVVVPGRRSQILFVSVILFRSFWLFRWFRLRLFWLFRFARFGRFGGFVSLVSVVSSRWFRFAVSGFSTCPFGF